VKQFCSSITDSALDKLRLTVHILKLWMQHFIYRNRNPRAATRGRVASPRLGRRSEAGLCPVPILGPEGLQVKAQPRSEGGGHRL